MVGLYLYDSTMLLNANEGVLSSTLARRWNVHFGSERFLLRGKEPLLPNPFLPHRPLFRLRWKQEEDIEMPSAPWNPVDVRPYSNLCPLIWGMVIAQFVLIPVGLFSRLGSAFVVFGLGLFYFNAIAALIYVLISRKSFGLSLRRVGAIAFESLTCPPFAINIVRHVSLSTEVAEDLLVSGRHLLHESDWPPVIAEAAKRVQSAIDWEAEGSERSAALGTYHLTLSNELKSCQDKSS